MNPQDRQAWHDWAEKTVAAMAGSCAAEGGGMSVVGLGRLDPVDQPLGCPLCAQEGVQVAALMFTLRDDRLAYVDATGLHLFDTGPSSPFQDGATMVFHCANGHLFYRHYRQASPGTRVTGLAVTVTGPVADQTRPLWPLSPARDRKEDAHG